MSNTGPVMPPLVPQDATPPPVDSSTPQDTSAIPPVSTTPAGPPTPTAQTVFPRKPGVSVDDQHHNMIGRVFNTIFSNKTPEWVQTENGPVKVQRQMGPGEVARGILAAAVTGLAAGYSPSTRGKGAGAAFGAGFQAEQAKKQQTEAQKQEQAQEAWKNTEGASEMQIRSAQNIREQMRSVEETQAHQINMQRAAQELEEGKYRQSKQIEADQQKISDTWNTLQGMHATPLIVDGKEARYHTLEDMNAARAQNNAAFMDSGRFLTRAVIDPTTHEYVVMKVPPGIDDLQWIGVKTNDEGNPIDKSGNETTNPKDMTANGDIVDDTGKPVVPPYKMTPRDYEKYRTATQAERLNREKDEAEIGEARARTASINEERQDRAEQHQATQEWNLAGGDPNAKGAKGKSILSSGSRAFLIKNAVLDANNPALEKQIEDGSKDGASDEEKADARAAEQERRDARTMVTLLRAGSPAEAAVKIKNQYTKADGSFDEDAAGASLDNAGVSGEMKKNILDHARGLGGTNFAPGMNISTDQYSQLASRSATLPTDRVIRGIQVDPNMNDTTKQRLIADVKSGKIKTLAPAQTIPPPVGQNQIPPEMRYAGPGATSQGTLPPQ